MFLRPGSGQPPKSYLPQSSARSLLKNPLGTGQILDLQSRYFAFARNSRKSGGFPRQTPLPNPRTFPKFQEIGGSPGKHPFPQQNQIQKNSAEGRRRRPPVIGVPLCTLLHTYLLLYSTPIWLSVGVHVQIPTFNAINSQAPRRVAICFP